MGLAISRSIESHGGRLRGPHPTTDEALIASFHSPTQSWKCLRQYDSEFLRACDSRTEPCLSTLICDKKGCD